MKIPFLIILLLIVCFTSCKKDKAISISNTISATVDNIDKSFNTKATATEGYLVGSGYILQINGTTADSIPENIFIIINSTANITKGTYPLSLGIPNGYNDLSTSLSYNIGYLTFYPSLNTALPNTVTITSISTTSVQGTFNANLTGHELSSSPIDINKTITNGKFNISIKQQ
ncbi:MAG: hypothetical protein JWQ84_3002 [Mucilaginibacter sp.]|nr:hypothetical protein [Mucilaginibacter sp.]